MKEFGKHELADKLNGTAVKVMDKDYIVAAVTWDGSIVLETPEVYHSDNSCSKFPPNFDYYYIFHFTDGSSETISTESEVAKTNELIEDLEEGFDEDQYIYLEDKLINLTQVTRIKRIEKTK